MARKLCTTVHVPGHGVFGPGDELPSEVRKILSDNPRVWDDGDDEGEETHPGPSETAAAVAEAAGDKPTAARRPSRTRSGK